MENHRENINFGVRKVNKHEKTVSTDARNSCVPKQNIVTGKDNCNGKHECTQSKPSKNYKHTEHDKVALVENDDK